MTTVIRGTDDSASTPAITGTDANTGIFFPAADTIAFAEGGAEVMRINSSGDVGIGTSSPSAELDVVRSLDGSTVEILVANTFYAASSTDEAVAFQGEFYQNDVAARRGAGYIQFTKAGDFSNNANASANMIFGTRNAGTLAERARITASGNLLVGTTTALGKVRFQQTADATTLTLTSAQSGFLSSNQGVLVITTTAGTSNPTASFAITSSYNGSGVFNARNDGTLYAQNTTVQSISDIRTKENIRDAEDGLDVITALRPVRFDFKEGFNNNRKNQLGFIAQEIEQVFPDAVDVTIEHDENGDPYKSVGPGALIPVLVKAIQELKAELDTTKARLAALEGV